MLIMAKNTVFASVRCLDYKIYIEAKLDLKCCFIHLKSNLIGKRFFQSLQVPAKLCFTDLDLHILGNFDVKMSIITVLVL